MNSVAIPKTAQNGSKSYGAQNLQMTWTQYQKAPTLAPDDSQKELINLNMENHKDGIHLKKVDRSHIV